MFASILASIHAHPVQWLEGAWLLSNAIGTLPTPSSQTGFYRWFFDFSHLVAGNATRIFATRYPSFFQQTPPAPPAVPPATPTPGAQ